MKTSIYVLTALLCLLAGIKATAQTQAPPLCYAHPITNQGGTNKVLTDNAQNVYLLGRFSGTFDFDPSPATATLSAKGPDDIFVAKYNSAGSYVWAFALGDTAAYSEYAIDFCLDDQNNVLVTGDFRNTIDFDPSPATAALTSTSSISFVAKYSSAGLYQWAQMIGDTNLGVTSICPGSSGSFFLGGGFLTTVDMDPTVATITLAPTSNASGFIAKYNSNASCQWAIALAAGFYDTMLASDAAGNCYAGGTFTGSPDFDPSPQGTATVSAGAGSTSFLAKYSGTSAFQWATPTIDVNGPGMMFTKGLSIDPSGNCFLLGRLYGSADADPTQNIYTLATSSAVNELFVSKYTSTGAFQWAFSIPPTPASGSLHNEIGSIYADGAGGVYLAGALRGTFDFDPSPGTYTVTSRAATGQLQIMAFIARYSGNKSLDWAFVTGYGMMGSACADNTGSVFAGGNFRFTELGVPGSTNYVARFGCLYTGMDEQDNALLLNVFPNPGNGLFTIEAAADRAELCVFNSAGQLTQALQLYNGQHTLDLSDQPPGLYFVQLKQDNAVRTLKLIRQ